MELSATRVIRLILALFFAHAAPVCTGDQPHIFDLDDAGGKAEPLAVAAPWRVVELESEYGGRWVVAGDIDGDGQVEIVSAENFNAGDVHYTSAVAAQKLDGTVLWTWGDPAIGRKEWHHDVACQIYDLDQDGRNEVILATKGFIVCLDGRTGKEIRRIAIEDEATDCIVICNLRGTGRPQDILVKDRYRRIWAYDHQGSLLWTVTDPGGFRTAHQPVPIDLDGDGRDEIMAGYAMLNHDGSIRWVYKSKTVDQRRGHLDCVRVLRRGEQPRDWRLVLTCCGANNIAVIDGEGRVLWERAGHHFESIKVGRFFGDRPGPQFVVDIDHRPFGESPLWVMDERGSLLARITTDYSRHHVLADWTGDGLDEIIVAYDGAVYDNRGRRVATLAVPGGDTARGKESVEQRSILVGDMDGDGVRDILIATNTAVYIYRNEKGARPKEKAPLGTGLNVTLY
jgi:hypothetical protein